MAIKRRVFFKQTGMIAAGLLTTQWQGASSFTKTKSGNPILEKKLDPKWIESLYAKGIPTTRLKSKNELDYIGMPVGDWLWYRLPR